MMRTLHLPRLVNLICLAVAAWMVVVGLVLASILLAGVL